MKTFGKVRFSKCLRTTLFTIGLLLISCGEQKTARNPQTAEKHSPEPSNYSLWEDAFETLKEDTLFVISSWDTDADTFAFKGTRLDSQQVMLLPKSSNYGYSSFNEFAACYKFEISNRIMGLIIREPGEYSPTQIVLHLFDLDKDSIVESIYLADVFGDAGEVHNYSSCLIRNTYDSTYTLIDYSYSSFTEIDDTITESSHSTTWYSITTQDVLKLSVDEDDIRSRFPRIIAVLEERTSDL